MKLVAKYHILPSLALEILLHVLTDNVDFAVRSLSKLVDDQVRFLDTKVVDIHCNHRADRAFQITLAVGAADKPARNVVVVSEFGPLSLNFYKLVSANVEPRNIIIFLLLASTQAIHCSIFSKFLNYLRFPNDKNV